jgi:hypothetical protein
MRGVVAPHETGIGFRLVDGAAKNRLAKSVSACSSVRAGPAARLTAKAAAAKKPAGLEITRNDCISLLMPFYIIEY